ncbi:MAG TPA: hypothetical protein VFD59_17145 [Nocardioidaceae bacterium]|nr:hypothetical protein [Nocardioidaceae bacterium]
MTNAPEPANTFSAPPGGVAPQQSWWWRLEDAAGDEVAVEGVSRQEFPSQSDAESWVGEIWQELLDGGAEAVTLFEGERRVYGPMGLRPA